MRATANEAAWREAQDVPTGMRDSTSLISIRKTVANKRQSFFCPKHLTQSESLSVVSAPHASRATEFPSETRGFICYESNIKRQINAGDSERNEGFDFPHLHQDT